MSSPSVTGACSISTVALCCRMSFSYTTKLSRPEHARDGAGLHSSDLLIHLVIDDPFEPHVSVFNDDTDGRLRINGILLQGRMAIDRTCDSNPQLIVKS